MKLPENWRRVPIKEVYEGLYDGPHATPKPSEEGPVFLGIGNVTEDGHLDFTKVRHISEHDYPKWTKRVTPQRGDIVFTYEATLNRYAIIPEGFRGCLGRRMALIRPDVEKIDTRFLHYYFFSKDWRDTIEANKLAGATVDRVPLTQFPEFPISLPPITVQRRISAILSVYDDLIENNTRRIEILEEMARRLYEEWFVHFRFPGHEEVKFKESELGRIPDGWEIVQLGEIVHEVKGTISPSRVDPDTPYVGLEHIPRRSITLKDWSTAGTVESSKLPFRKGDILFGKIRPYFHKVSVAPVDGICSSDTILLRAKQEEHFGLALCCASSDEFVDHATQTSNGTKMPRANWKVLSQYPLLLPSVELLNTFNSFVSDIVSQCRTLVFKNANLRAQRDLLLPKLVSGEIDVSDIPMPDDKEVEAA